MNTLNSQKTSSNLSLKKTVLAITCVVTGATTYGAQALGPSVKSKQQMALAHMLIEFNSMAEGKLYNNMQSVANSLDVYVKQSKRLPVTSNEVEEFCQDALLKLDDNPYHEQFTDSKQETTQQAALPDQETLHDLRVVIDNNLAENKIDEVMASPPESWRAKPGSITVVTNGINLAVIWGAGSNQAPIIRQDGSGKSLMILFHLN